MDAFRCKSCNELILDPAKHICCNQFAKVEISGKDFCKINGHLMITQRWTDDWSGSGERIDVWENDDGHFAPYEFRQMETTTCSICGFTETRCVGTFPNPHFKR